MSPRRRTSRKDAATLAQRAALALLEQPDECLEEIGRHFTAATSTGRGRGLVGAALVVSIVLALGEVGWVTPIALLLLAGGHFLGAAGIRRHWDTKLLAALDRRWPR